MAYYDDILLDTQFEDGGDGRLFEYELVYYPTTTDTGTPEGSSCRKPDGVVGTRIRDLGDDKETYRWFLFNKNESRGRRLRSAHRVRQGLRPSGATFHSQIDDVHRRRPVAPGVRLRDPQRRRRQLRVDGAAQRRALRPARGQPGAVLPARHGPRFQRDAEPVRRAGPGRSSSSDPVKKRCSSATSTISARPRTTSRT